MHGGVKKDALGAADPAAVQRGSANLQRHIRNVKQFGVPALVALNRFIGDTPAEVDAVRAACAAEGAELVPCEVWEKGGEGGVAVAEAPVCMAKTQYSFSDDPTKLGAPTGFTLQVRDIIPSAGAGFVVALAGDIMTMPGLGKSPAAERIRLHPDGTIEGLF